MSAGDVIFACATASGQAGVAVIRVSGDAAGDLFPVLTGKPPPAPRRASLRRLVDPSDGAMLDQALTLWFPAPHSFTGENTAELHVHGGAAVITGVMEALAGIAGFRPAEPGEFTRRAFRNGKLDLAEAEGLGDLIAADTAAARRQALWQLEGGLSALYADWRERLAVRLAFAEASLDFADEPLPHDLEAANREAILALRSELELQLSSNRPTERMRDGLYVALVGPPNVGKSSLLNALAGRDAAIVTDIPGTTRDVMEVRLDIGGYPVLVADTAGLRESEDVVEQEGMRRARIAASNADMVVTVAECQNWPNAPAALTQGTSEKDSPNLVFWNKSDAVQTQPVLDDVKPAIWGAAKIGAGLDLLEDAIRQVARQAFESGPSPGITQARHRVALEDCVAALHRWEHAPAPELATEDLRLAMRSLGRVVGLVDVEDLLDRIFSAFCIGK